LLAARATPIGGRLLLDGGGLLRQGQIEHLLGENLTDFEENVFDLAEPGSPSRTLGPIKLLDKVFGDPFDVRPQFFYLRSALLASRHP
jgi:hypothetical protein